MEFNWGELVAPVLAGLLGALVPMLGSWWFAFKAKAKADEVTDWKDYVVQAVDSLDDVLDYEPKE